MSPTPAVSTSRAPATGRLVVLALVAALGVSTAAYLHAGHTPWWHALGAGTGEVANMALVVGVAWCVASSRGASRGEARGARRPGAPLIRHAAGATAVAALATAVGYASVRFGHPATGLDTAPGAHPTPRGNAVSIFFWYVFLYGAAAAATHAVRAGAKLREREVAAARAELQALRARLDPHFLFNALHSVGVLVRADPAGAEDAVERLGDLLRYVLRANRPAGGAGSVGSAGGLAGERVPLAAELAFVRDYLAVEGLRFGGRLRPREEVVPDALDCLVPALLLQPLVENAVKHAVGPRPEGATVRIAARRARDPRLGDVLELEVADDGPGAPTVDGQAAAGDGSGLGLAAVRGQLAAYHPGRHRCDVVTGPGRGFRIRILLPAERDEGWRDHPSAPLAWGENPGPGRRLAGRP